MKKDDDDDANKRTPFRCLTQQSGSSSHSCSLCTVQLNRVCVQCLAPWRQALPRGVPLGFSDRKVIFGPRGVGSDVTSVSSSSGPGSSLDPEILPSFSCCSGRGGRGAEPTDSDYGGQAGGRVVGGGSGGGGSALSHPSPLTQWCFSRWQMLLNPAWPRELWWPGWVTGP